MHPAHRRSRACHFVVHRLALHLHIRRVNHTTLTAADRSLALADRSRALADRSLALAKLRNLLHEFLCLLIVTRLRGLLSHRSVSLLTGALPLTLLSLHIVAVPPPGPPDETDN